jgi:hypothetical protein
LGGSKVVQDRTSWTQMLRRTFGHDTKG